MVCPHCQQELPEKYSASYCFRCSGALQPQDPVYEARSRHSLPPFKLNWWIFFAVLLAAPLLTSLAAFLGKGQVNEAVSPVIGLVGGIGCGIACGILLALRVGKRIETRIALGIAFAVVFAVVCVLLSFFGCAASYQLRIGG